MITDIEKLSPDTTESAYINCDCMDGMKLFPDNYFDLAIVDPPYGDADAGGTAARRDSAAGSTSTRINRGGWHGKQKYHLGTTLPAEELPQTGWNMGLRELAGRGRRNTQKNHCVGCCAGKRIF